MTQPPFDNAIAERIRANPVDGAPEMMRRAFDALFPQAPDGQALTLAGRSAVGYGAGRPVLWLHGGGLVFGGPRSHGAAAARLAALAGRRVIVPRYRLAPEHPWPAQLEDALAVLDAINGPAALVGDSAGGQLALAVARRRPGRIKALALISPNSDRSGQSRTRRANSDTDLMNSDDDDRRLARMAMPGLEPSDPDASPVLADLSGLPRTYLVASSSEVLLDDTLLLERALIRWRVPVTMQIVAGLWHLWPLWSGELAAAETTLARIAAALTEPGQI